MATASRSIGSRVDGHIVSQRRFLAVVVAAWTCATASFATAAPNALGQQLATKGGANVPPCASCHGAGGEGQAAAGFPRLAGQQRGYLLKQLSDFASGRRSNPVMAPIAKALDERERTAASDYYSGLRVGLARVGSGSSGAASAGSQSDAQRERGARLALQGDWGHEIPACFSCHGPAGVGVGANFPRIGGQLASYTERQIRDWKGAARSNDPGGLMKSVADRLDDEQITAVSQYLERLPEPKAE